MQTHIIVKNFVMKLRTYKDSIQKANFNKQKVCLDNKFTKQEKRSIKNVNMKIDKMYVGSTKKKRVIEV